VSFIRNFGSGFEEAKAKGASDAEALTAAGLSGLANALVESSGGIEALPGKAKTGGFRAWAGSALQEGLEEPVQSVVSNAVSKGIYDHARPVASLTDESAVLNPNRAGRELALGTAVGAIVGGGEMLGNAVVNADGLTGVVTNEAKRVKTLANASKRQIETFVQNAFQKRNTCQYLKVKEVSPELVEHLKTVNIDVSGYDHVLHDNDLRHIRLSHGELSNDKYKVTAEDLTLIPGIIENYDVLYLGYKTKDGNQTIGYEKTIDQKIFYVEEILDDGVLSTKQMMKVGKKRKPSFLKKFTKVTDADPDTDVPPEAEPTGLSPPGKHVQDARSYADYSFSIARKGVPVNGMDLAEQHAWQIPVWSVGNLAVPMQTQAEILRQMEAVRAQYRKELEEAELERAFLRGFDMEE